MNDHAHGHPNVKLQTPKSKLQASNSKLRASNSKPQASNSKHEAVPFSASVEVSFRPENAATYSVGDEDRKLSGVFSKTHAFLRSSAPSLGWPYIRSAIFLLITHMRIVHTQVQQGSFHAVSSPCALYSFTMIILGF